MRMPAIPINNRSKLEGSGTVIGGIIGGVGPGGMINGIIGIKGIRGSQGGM